MLLQAEDDGDVKAASKAKAEIVAEMAEFDENFSSSTDDKVITSTKILFMLKFAVVVIVIFIFCVLFVDPTY